MDRLRSRKRLVLIICALAVGIGAFAAGCSKGSSDNSGAAGGRWNYSQYKSRGRKR